MIIFLTGLRVLISFHSFFESLNGISVIRNDTSYDPLSMFRSPGYLPYIGLGLSGCPKKGHLMPRKGYGMSSEHAFDPSINSSMDVR